MKAVAVKKRENRLRAYLREVKNGEVVLVTDRGVVVAELREPRAGAVLDAHDQAFPDLVVLTVDERVRANAALLGFPAEVPRA